MYTPDPAIFAMVREAARHAQIQEIENVLKAHNSLIRSAFHNMAAARTAEDFGAVKAEIGPPRQALSELRAGLNDKLRDARAAGDADVIDEVEGKREAASDLFECYNIVNNTASTGQKASPIVSWSITDSDVFTGTILSDSSDGRTGLDPITMSADRCRVLESALSEIWTASGDGAPN